MSPTTRAARSPTADSLPVRGGPSPNAGAEGVWHGLLPRATRSRYRPRARLGWHPSPLIIVEPEIT